jgi:hypothetical protein
MCYRLTKGATSTSCSAAAARKFPVTHTNRARFRRLTASASTHTLSYVMGVACSGA